METTFGEEIKHRLSRECTTHERNVREVILAWAAGELEADLALRRCALELHSLKGVVGMLGLSDAISAIGNLCDAMLVPGTVPKDDFWKDFQPWTEDLIHYIRTCADGRPDASCVSEVDRLRGDLVRRLESRPAAPDAPPSESVPQRSLTPSAGRRLLIIDDSATVRAVLSVKLGEKGYPVRAARSIQEGAVALLEFNPEIVITDVHMPEIEGDEICRRIKSNMKQLVPVIFYSSLPEHELARRAQAAGADAYVCKDQGIDGLTLRMDELLSDEILF